MLVGDIVEHSGKRWAVLQSVPSPSGRPNWLIGRTEATGRPTTHVIGGDAPVVFTPAFAPGQRLRYRQRAVTVIADHGDRVTVSYTLHRPPYGQIEYRPEVPRGSLARDAYT
jgi:hypothetical protein